MRFRVITCVYSLILLVCAAHAQDLEEDFVPLRTEDRLQTVEVDDFEEDILTVAPRRVAVIPDYASSPVSSKREQLGVVLRRAYYQKLTTPRWVAILSADSWRDSFVKWRYYAQLRNYISDLDQDLTYFRLNAPEPKEVREPVNVKDTAYATLDLDSTIFIEDSLQVNIDAMVQAIIDDNDPDDIVQGESLAEVESLPMEDSKQAVLTQDQLATDAEKSAPKPTTQPFALLDEEEDWENQETTFEFSVSQLTLPDSIIAERPVQIIEIESLSDSLVNVVAEVEKGNTPPEGRDREGQSSKSRSSNENFTKNVKPVMADSKSVSTSPQKVATNQPKTEPVTSASAATPSPPISAPSATKTNTVARPSRPTNTARSAITRSFTNKRGTMPWPIIKGEISERYGIRLNAETRGLKSRNFGLDFSCPPASSILAVHQGTVLLISESDFEGSTVTLKHGDYLTVYYNLSTVDVRRGDVVAMGQRLGRLATGATDKVFHFEVWEDQHRTNPERWLQTR